MKYFLIIFLLISGVTLWAIDVEEINYRLDVSRALVALEKGDLVLAGRIGKRLEQEHLKKSIKRGEVFFILGEINFRERLYAIALSYYEKAEQEIASFLFEEDVFTLMWRIKAIYDYQDNSQYGLRTLNKIIDFTRNKRDVLSQYNRGKAYFYLGIKFGELKRWFIMIEHLSKAAQNEYHLEVVYLLQTYYYAQFSQNKITEHYKDYYNSTKDVPERVESFSYYYRLWREQKSEADKNTSKLDLKDLPQWSAKNLPSYENIQTRVVDFKNKLLQEYQSKGK